ncbi:Uncharacterised protein [Mycobacterium tuberculosis]|nr:Uncharacterised protein [Mycobacterium tuberculosis]
MRQPFRCDADGRLGSSDPKPREGTETFARVPVSVVNRQSSDPKPREGTETRQQSRRPARMTPVVRPKTPRGDGNWIALTGLALILVVVRPKTPRGDGNSTSISLTSPGEKITSSDPKPRERTETRRRSRRCRCPNRRVVRPKTPRGDGNPQLSIADAVQLVRVVRPKTPRGDGNLERVTADGTIETSRQTQNPERGRKPNLTACWVRRARRESSDPKP